MKLTTHPIADKPTTWPRLMRHQVTGTIYLVPAISANAQAIDIETAQMVSVPTIANVLEDLPAGYSVTLTNE